MDADLEELLLGRGWVIGDCGESDFYDWPASKHDFSDSDLDANPMTYIGVMITDTEEFHYDVHHVGPDLTDPLTGQVKPYRSYTDCDALVADLDSIEAIRYGGVDH